MRYNLVHDAFTVRSSGLDLIIVFMECLLVKRNITGVGVKFMIWIRGFAILGSSSFSMGAIQVINATQPFIEMMISLNYS